MRGSSVSPYVLVAFATTAYAAPLIVRTDDILEAREAYALEGNYVPKVETVDAGKDFVQRRSPVGDNDEDDLAMLAATSGASTSAPKAGGAGTSKAGVTMAGAKPSGATNASASANATSKAASAGEAKATTPADLPGCPAEADAKASRAAGNGTATATGKKPTARAAGTAPVPKGTATNPKPADTKASKGAAPLGSDPTKPQVASPADPAKKPDATTPVLATPASADGESEDSEEKKRSLQDDLSELLGGLTGTANTAAAAAASPSGAAAANPFSTLIEVFGRASGSWHQYYP